MKKAEIIFGIIGLVATFLYLFAIPGMAFVAMASLASLLAIYFYFGFALFNEIRLRKIFWAKNYKHISRKRLLGGIAAGWAISLLLLGAYFKFLSWPNPEFNLIIGIVGVSIVLIISVFKYSKNKSDYFLKIIKRCLVFLIFGAVVIALPDVKEFRKQFEGNSKKVVWTAIEDDFNKNLNISLYVLRAKDANGILRCPQNISYLKTKISGSKDIMDSLT